MPRTFSAPRFSHLPPFSPISHSFSLQPLSLSTLFFPSPLNAIQELQLRQRRAAAQHHRHLDSPSCDHCPDESCLAHAIGNLCQTFLLLRAFKLVRRQILRINWHMVYCLVNILFRHLRMMKMPMLFLQLRLLNRKGYPHVCSKL